jgi:SAM-dependent methyltransferase
VARERKPAAARRSRKVRAQYEALPYPERNPADEARRLITGSPSHLAEIEHYLRGGRPAGGLRALVAGGGTGDGAIMLAQQLADRGEGGTVDYLDLSEASLKIARRRAKVRGLSNLTFHHASLLDLPRRFAEPFDYIDCCGVLHHLESPEDGLTALTSVLAPDGGMGLMLYGEYGRTGVYPLQSALRRLTGGNASIAAQLRLARRVLEELPASNWLKRNPFVGDHLAALAARDGAAGADAGLYDLLLHARDRAYRVPEIVELCGAAGLEIVDFIEPKRYDPALYLADPAFADAIAGLDRQAGWALAEEVSGAMKAHTFYVHRRGAAAGPADPANLDLAPVLRDGDAADFARRLAGSPRLTVDFDGTGYAARLTPRQIEILGRADGSVSARGIARDLGFGEAEFRDAYAGLLGALMPLNLLLLRFPRQG